MLVCIEAKAHKQDSDDDHEDFALRLAQELRNKEELLSTPVPDASDDEVTDETPKEAPQHVFQHWHAHKTSHDGDCHRR